MSTIKYLDQWTSAPMGPFIDWFRTFKVSPMTYWCTRAYTNEWGAFGPRRHGLRLFWN